SAAAAAACARPPQSTPLRGAAGWLWSQQAQDGGFHSQTYGLLRSGQSLTPFVLNTLLEVPQSVVTPPKEGIDRAVDFIFKNTNVDGSLGLMDATVADYPNYATALAVLATSRAYSRTRSTDWERRFGRMIASLRAQQFTEDQGWK